MDFYDAYFDFNSVSLKLPGFTLNAFKYWDGQPMRFRARTKDRSATFFTIIFELLDRESLGLGKTGNVVPVAKEVPVASNDEFPPEMMPPPEVLGHKE
jgi:hypothetical protein